MYLTLQILLLVGLCSKSMGHRRVYHFIDERKTWTEAQCYCRENYTDLATFTNMADMNSVDFNANSYPEAWIGLYNTNITHTRNRMWHWSQPGRPSNKSDDNKTEGLNCKYVTKNSANGTLVPKQTSCEESHPFLCYNATSPEKYVAIEYKLIWIQAQRYCRVNHTDLVSGSDQWNDTKLLEMGANFSRWWWIGQFRDAWAWSDGSGSSFRHWSDTGSNKFKCDNKCAKLRSDGQWKNVDCEKKHSFICYDDHMVLVKENMTWEDALVHCRSNYGELAIMTDELDQEKVQEKVQAKANMADTEYVWVGLHFSSFFEEWMWVNGEWVTSDDSHWEKINEQHDWYVSGAMKKNGNEKWFKKSSGEQYNFVCAIY